MLSSLTHQSIFSNKTGLGVDIYGSKVRHIPGFQIYDSLRWNKLKNIAQKPITVGINGIQKVIDMLQDSKESGEQSAALSKRLKEMIAQQRPSESSPGDEIPNILVNLSSSKLKTKVNYALEAIATKTSLRSLTFLEKVMSYLIDAVKLLLSLSSISKKIQGFRVGYKKIERGIKLG